ncbi:MAG: Cof-type HAD-IIB family hydrolase [Ginsengibacter sp.]
MNSSQYKAVFIDIDGTLIKKDHSLSPLTIETIKKIKQLGIHVILVSARPYHGILSISDQLELSNIPIASLNGSYIREGNTILLNAKIDLNTLQALHKELKNFNVSIIYYQQMKWFAEVENQFTENEKKITEVPLIIEDFEKLIQRWKSEDNAPNKLLVVGEAGEIQNIQMQTQPEFLTSLNMCTSKPVYLEVMNIGSSKQTAIEYFLKHLNLQREEVIAIGDNFNDIEMIQFAGLGIAMGNAPDEVKAKADYVTDTNNNDGVAKALNKFILLQESSA